MKIRARKKKLDRSRMIMARFLMRTHRAVLEARNGLLTPYVFSEDRKRVERERSAQAALRRL